MAAVHLSYEFLVLGSCWPEKCAQLTLQLLTLVRAVRAWKPERLEQIVDILVPQTEDEIAEGESIGTSRTHAVTHSYLLL